MKSINYISSRIEKLNINQLKYIIGGDGGNTLLDEQDHDAPDIKA
ncbi:MAG TPA: hypothetical protein PK711_04765 [Bacteroidales bacterium]|nr:hypothetical protein [Bacteroidales bacterium]